MQSQLRVATSRSATSWIYQSDKGSDTIQHKQRFPWPSVSTGSVGSGGDNCPERHLFRNLEQQTHQTKHKDITGDRPADTRRGINVGLSLVHRRRRWTNVKSTLIQRLVSAGERPPWAVLKIKNIPQHPLLLSVLIILWYFYRDVYLYIFVS